MIYRSFLTICCVLVLRLPGVAAGAPPATPPRETLDGIPVLSELPTSVADWAARTAQSPSLHAYARSSDNMSSGGHLFLVGEKMPLGPAPATPWAKPLAGRRLRLIVMPSVMANNHDVAEIERALDCEVFHIHSPLLHGRRAETLPEEMEGYFADRALETLKHEADVILVDPRARFFPARVADAVLAKVRAGCGLVMLTGARYGGGGQFGTWPLEANIPAAWKTLSLIQSVGGMEYRESHAVAGTNSLFAGIPWAMLPPFHLPDLAPVAGAEVAARDQGRPLAITGRLGQGRVIVLPYSTYYGAFPVDEMTGKTVRLRVTDYQEYYAAALARTILWAAGRELPVRLETERLERPAGVAGPVTLRLTGAPANARAEVRVRELTGATLWQGQPRVAQGAAAVNLPAFAVGSYLLDTIVRDRAGCSLGWGTTIVEVTGPGTWQVTLDKPRYAAGEPATVTAQASALPTPGNWTAVLTVTDANDRRLFRETQPLAAGQAKWTYPNRSPLTCLHELQVVLQRDGAPYLTAKTDLYVPRFDVPEFTNWLWPAWPPVYSARRTFRRMRETLGFDFIMGSGGSLDNRELAASGARIFATEMAAVDPVATESAPVKTKEQVLARVRAGTPQFALLGAGGLFAQDERHAGNDSGQATPEALARFREYLRSRYANVAELNRAWGGKAFASFDTVVPGLAKEFVPGPDLNLAPWLEWRLWALSEVVGIDRAATREIRRIIGQPCHVGTEGIGGFGQNMPYGGIDPVAQAEDCWDAPGIYQDDMLNLYRSFYPGPLMGWNGYSSPWPDLQRYAWSCALHSRGAMGWWYGPVFYNEAYDCLQMRGKWVAELTRPLREGVGRLIMESGPPAIEPIAFLYSQSSVYAMSILGKTVNPANDHLFLRPAEWAQASLHRLFRDCGVQFGYLAEQQLQRGQTGGVKVLVLSSSVALAPATCRGLEQFVAAGGIVVADLCPATWDDRGEYHQPGQLDPLFGVKHEGKFQFRLMPNDWGVGSFENEPGFQIAGEWFIGQYYESSLRVADGHALGKHIFETPAVPAFVFKRTGKGAAILMNFLETEYQRVPESRQREFVKAVLALAKIQPRLVVRDIGAANDLCEENLDITRYADGAAEYYGMLTAAKRLRVTLPTVGHVYELARHQYFGQTNEVALDFREAPHALLAVLPYQIEAVRVKAERGRLGNGLPLQINLQTTGQPVKHVVHLKITKPDGSEYFGLSRNVVLVNGKWNGVLPLALNDPTGTWRVNVREVVSGLTSETTAAVKK